MSFHNVYDTVNLSDIMNKCPINAAHGWETPYLSLKHIHTHTLKSITIFLSGSGHFPTEEIFHKKKKKGWP